MTLEKREGQSPSFRITTKPMIPGSNPYEEPRYKDEKIGSLNYRAILEEMVYLYDGPVQKVVIGNEKTTVRSFIDIRSYFYTNRQQVYHPSVNWGLKFVDSEEDVSGYIDQGTMVDPIHVYRVAKGLERLNKLDNSAHYPGDDFYAISNAVRRVFDREELEDLRERDLLLQQRHAIAEWIGNDDFRRILQDIPPRLEETIVMIREKGAYLMISGIQREIKAKKINPSEFYRDLMDEYWQFIDDIAKGLEESDGAW